MSTKTDAKKPPKPESWETKKQYRERLVLWTLETCGSDGITYDQLLIESVKNSKLDDLSISKESVVRDLHLLEQKGLAERALHGSDGRRYLWFPTKKESA